VTPGCNGTFYPIAFTGTAVSGIISLVTTINFTNGTNTTTTLTYTYTGLNSQTVSHTDSLFNTTITATLINVSNTTNLLWNFTGYNPLNGQIATTFSA